MLEIFIKLWGFEKWHAKETESNTTFYHSQKKQKDCLEKMVAIAGFLYELGILGMMN